MWLTPKTTWKTSDYMLPTTYNPLLKGGLNSMNNYPFDAMPCTNARRWTRTTELEREQIYSLSSLPLDYTCLLKTMESMRLELMRRFSAT